VFFVKQIIVQCTHNAVQAYQTHLFMGFYEPNSDTLPFHAGVMLWMSRNMEHFAAYRNARNLRNKLRVRLFATAFVRRRNHKSARKEPPNRRNLASMIGKIRDLRRRSACCSLRPQISAADFAFTN
jgi:hypothetical protein